MGDSNVHNAQSWASVEEGQRPNTLRLPVEEPRMFPAVANREGCKFWRQNMFLLARTPPACTALGLP